MKYPQFRDRSIEDIVWIQTSFIGDVVINSAAFSLLNRLYPSVKQHLITTSVAASLFSTQSYLDSVISFKKGGVGFSEIRKVKEQVLAQISDLGTAVTLQPHRSLRSSMTLLRQTR